MSDVVTPINALLGVFLDGNAPAGSPAPRGLDFRSGAVGVTSPATLNAGLLDEIHVDVAAVLLGSGVRLFDHLAGAPTVLGNPTVIAGVGVTHLRYPVRKA